MSLQDKKLLRYFIENVQPIYKKYEGEHVGLYEIEKIYDQPSNEQLLDVTHMVVIKYPDRNSITETLKDPDYIKLLEARTKIFPSYSSFIAKSFSLQNYTSNIAN